jgi:hypothetical protein
VHTGTVLLHLYAAALAKRAISPSIPALYIPVPSPFPALEAFISHAARLYSLSVFACGPPSSTITSIERVKPHGDASTKVTNSMREALGVYRACFPTLEAILVGTRRTDPHGGAHTMSFSCQPFLLVGAQQRWTSACIPILTGHLLCAYTQSSTGVMRTSGHSFAG